MPLLFSFQAFSFQPIHILHYSTPPSPPTSTPTSPSTPDVTTQGPIPIPTPIPILIAVPTFASTSGTHHTQTHTLECPSSQPCPHCSRTHTFDMPNLQPPSFDLGSFFPPTERVWDHFWYGMSIAGMIGMVGIGVGVARFIWKNSVESGTVFPPIERIGDCFRYRISVGDMVCMAGIGIGFIKVV